MSGVRLAARLVLAMSLLMAGCGGETVDVITVATTLPPASTTVPATTTTTEPSTTEPQPTTTSTGGSTTTTTLPPATTATLPGWVAQELPEALPPEAIPWEQVGTGWLLVRYVQARSGWDQDAPQALLLVDPEDTLYLVSGWQGAPVLDWSPEGSRVLFFDGLLRMIDLRDGATSVIPVDLPADLDASDAGYSIEARFTRPTGRDVVVRVQDSADHVRLECLRTDGTLFSLLADVGFSYIGWEGPGTNPSYVFGAITWLYAAAGTQVVIATSDGIRLLTNQGAPVRLLDTPGLGCTLSRWWDERSVLAACYDSEWATSPCWDQTPEPGGRSLWSVPIDGSPATRLTPQPVCRADWDWLFPHAYWDGLRVGGVVAARTPACCGCGGSLHLISGQTVTLWEGYAAWESPWGPADPMCAPALVGVRQGRLLVLDAMFGRFGVIFEVAADGTTLRAVTPTDTSRTGGIWQVLTTEESGYTAVSW